LAARWRAFTARRLKKFFLFEEKQNRRRQATRRWGWSIGRGSACTSRWRAFTARRLKKFFLFEEKQN
jgi:hypothetical protein